MRRGESGAAYRAPSGEWEPVTVLLGLLERPGDGFPALVVRRRRDGQRLVAFSDLRLKEVPG